MKRSKIAFYLIVSIIVTAAYQFSALGIEKERYATLRIIIAALIILTFIISYKNPTIYVKKNSLYRIHFLGLLGFSIVLLLISVVVQDVDIYSLKDIFLALVILTISFNMSLSEKEISQLVFVYILFYTIAATSLILEYAPSLAIQKMYLPIPKNQLSPAFGIAFVLSIYTVIVQKGLIRWVSSVLGILLFMSIIILRSRSVIVAIILLLVITVLFYLKNNKYRIFSILVLALTIQYAWSYIYESIFLNFDPSNIEAVSAGRTIDYEEGYSFLLTHPFVGNLQQKLRLEGIIHNFVLVNLVSYGILFSIPVLVIYFKYIIKIANAVLYKHKKYQYKESGPLVMIVLFVSSVFEYSFPFGPGSATFFAFFLFGQYIKEEI